MAVDGERLKKYAGQYKIMLDEKMLMEFQLYGEMLQEWNQKVNLTAIVDDEGILIKHFFDSLLLLDAVELSKDGKLIDVGTGAGFPGLPVKIVTPGIDLTLIDSLKKRIAFLTDLCEKLSLETKLVHGRAEELGKAVEYRERYDIATAKAVTDLRELSEYCIPFVKVGGCFAALKGFDVEEELKRAEKAITVLGGKVKMVKKYLLPDGSRRSIVCIEKISQTPAKYPRAYSKMAKSPLN